MKKHFILILSLAIFSIATAQNLDQAAIIDASIQIHASLNNEPLAWASNRLKVNVNKITGLFEAVILVDDLDVVKRNQGHTPDANNLGKFLTLSGVIPIKQILDGGDIINMGVGLTVSFEGREQQSVFQFSIFRVQPRGFSVMASGSITHSDLGIENLKELEDQLIIAMRFTGF